VKNLVTIACILGTSLVACREGEEPGAVEPTSAKVETPSAQKGASPVTKNAGSGLAAKPSVSAAPGKVTEDLTGKGLDDRQPSVQVDGPEDPPATDPEAEPTESTGNIEVLVDCNRATTNFGLTYHEKRYRIGAGGGLDKVLRAFSQAVSGQAEFIDTDEPVKYCGYADQIVCPGATNSPTSPGMGAWVDVCRPFNEDRAFGEMAGAVKHLERQAARRGGIGMLLTHGLITTADGSERGGADPATLVAGLPVRALADALVNGKTSLTIILIEDVPFKYGRHGDLKLRKADKQPVAPMAMLVWGPDDEIMSHLVASIIENLKPLSPKAVRLASYDPALHGPVLSSATLHQTKIPKPGATHQPQMTKVMCKVRQGRSAKCETDLVNPKTTYNQPQRDVLAVIFETAPAEPDVAAAFTWRPGPIAEALTVEVAASYRGPRGAPGPTKVPVENLVVDVPFEANMAIATGSLYLAGLAPLARCSDALRQLERLVSPTKLEPRITTDQSWSRTVLLPARCLASDETLANSGPRGGGQLVAIPESFELELSIEGRAPNSNETRDALEQLMNEAGWPQSDVGSETVPGLRQTVLAIASIAIEKAHKRGNSPQKIATIEVVVK